MRDLELKDIMCYYLPHSTKILINKQIKILERIDVDFWGSGDINYAIYKTQLVLLKINDIDKPYKIFNDMDVIPLDYLYNEILDEHYRKNMTYNEFKNLIITHKYYELPFKVIRLLCQMKFDIFGLFNMGCAVEENCV
jgi:hypothetical protein